MDITKALYSDESSDEDTEDTGSNEDAAISLALDTDDEERIQNFKDAVRACLKNYGG